MQVWHVDTALIWLEASADLECESTRKFLPFTIKGALIMYGQACDMICKTPQHYLHQ